MSMKHMLDARPSFRNRAGRFLRNSRSAARSSLLLFLLVFGLPRLARAQAYSSIAGTVTDPSGAPVASASISARNLETGAVRQSSTSDSGRYKILALPVGRYEVKASKAGFENSIRTGIELALGQEASIDFRLQVGTVSSEITVTSDAP